ESISASAFIAATFHSDDAAEAMRELFVDRHARSLVMITRAIERGEVPADTDPAAVVRAAVAPLYYRLFISREPIAKHVAGHAAAAGLAAARAGAFVQSPRSARSSRNR